MHSSATGTPDRLRIKDLFPHKEPGSSAHSRATNIPPISASRRSPRAVSGSLDIGNDLKNQNNLGPKPGLTNPGARTVKAWVAWAAPRTLRHRQKALLGL
jgi:hypothetical protein